MRHMLLTASVAGARPGPELAFYGDSITQVGFGRPGVIQTGNGGVPTASTPGRVRTGTVHPSAQGHRKVADRLFALIAKEHQ
ncbi:hypothetical protein ACFY1L_02480 [Streptomyces sp. NPDC001663]|uniref:hypothetical protein n=1 Tax=Streptomyces sp. NPDC001663 TaxID=3364597 RepID=UPI0036A3270E